jgi:phenylacetate-CoA ligase
LKIPPHIAEGLYWAALRLRNKTAVRARIELLVRTQWLSPASIRELQLDKLRRLTKHCYETVPYYRNAMDRCGIRPEHIHDFDAFAKIPLLRRDALRGHQKSLLSSTSDREKVALRHSSGSTGQRTEFFQDADFDLWSRAHQIRTYGWCGGWRIGEPFALVWGAPMHIETKLWPERAENFLSNRIELASFRLDPQSIENLLARLLRFRPALISGYTTALYLLAQLALQKGVHLEGLLAVQPNAEPLSQPMRETMERGFDCPVFDKYGTRESNIVAHESPHHEGMCIQAEHTYVEFMNDNDRPCKPGELGKVVLTTLNNFAMPLLRYETSDLASPVRGYCSSGVGLPRMSHVAGRLQDLLCTPAGGVIHPQVFSNIMRQFAEVAWFQIVQQKESELLVRVWAPNGLSLDSQARITGLIREQSGFPLDMCYELLPGMPESQTGKFRLCICEVARNHSALAHLNEMRAGR